MLAAGELEPLLVRQVAGEGSVDGVDAGPEADRGGQRRPADLHAVHADDRAGEVGLHGDGGDARLLLDDLSLDLLAFLLRDLRASLGEVAAERLHRANRLARADVDLAELEEHREVRTQLVGAVERDRRVFVGLLLGERDAAIEVLAGFGFGIVRGQRQRGERAEHEREGGGSGGDEGHGGCSTRILPYIAQVIPPALRAGARPGRGEIERTATRVSDGNANGRSR